MSEEQQQEVVEVKTVTRDLVINSHASEVDIALLEDNALVELHREKTNNQFAVGDVYRRFCRASMQPSLTWAILKRLFCIILTLAYRPVR